MLARLTVLAAGLLGAALAALSAARLRRERHVARTATALEAHGPAEPFRTDMVDGLPEPARRYLLHAIAPGTPLARSVRLEIDGSIRLSRGAAPLALTSDEVLAPGRGFLWRARVRRGPVRIRGYDAYVDGRASMRWWLWGAVPVARADGPDLARSAAGRLLGESFLVPATLLPCRGARWEDVDETTARVHIAAGDVATTLTITVDDRGRLRRLAFPRWNADPANGPVGPLRFDSDAFGGERSFDGYTIPTTFRAGWRLGDADEFPFFYADIRAARYDVGARGRPIGGASVRRALAAHARPADVRRRTHARAGRRTARWIGRAAAVCTLLALTAALPEPRPDAGTDPVAEEIRRLLAGGARVKGASLLEAPALRSFYARREFERVWAPNESANGRWRTAIAQLAADGLDAKRYHAAAVARLAGLAMDDPADVAALDVLRTDALVAAGRHLAAGRVDPRAVHDAWGGERRGFEPAGLLQRLADGADPVALLDSLRPETVAYRQLRAAHARYRAAGERWPRIDGRTIEHGDSGAAVTALRRRLAAELTVSLGDAAEFDGRLDGVVRAWQAARGLEPDGVVGARTRAALRVPPPVRVHQLALALERSRWEAPPDAGLRVLVRVPAFELDVLEDGRQVMTMRVIGGRADWPTPVFDAVIRSVVLSPYWNVPPRIAATEVIPAVLRNRAWLAANHMRILDSAGRIVDPGTIDWRAARAGRFPFRFRQDPGPDNPLGAIKFVLPNRFSVFLHDTPARSSFARADRARSHGCVRLERPFDLATLLLRGTGWDRDRLRAGGVAGTPTTIALPRPVPVSIRYATAWVAADGTAHFRDDPYGHDPRLSRLVHAATGDVVTAGGACQDGEVTP